VRTWTSKKDVFYKLSIDIEWAGYVRVENGRKNNKTCHWTEELKEKCLKEDPEQDGEMWKKIS